MPKKVNKQLAHDIAIRENIEEKIFLIRGHKVMIDYDLALLYGVETKYLNRQVKRNQERFPEEFMFRLNQEEKEELVTNWHRLKALKHSSSLPQAFTENGVAMLASVLNSDRAIKISIYIIKTFVKLRRWIAGSKELSRRLDQLEARVGQHDEEIRSIFEALHELIDHPSTDKSKRSIGFQQDE